MENLNERKYLDFVTQKLAEVLSRVEAAPGAQIQTGQGGLSGTHVPTLPDGGNDADGEDVRRPDARVRDEGEEGSLPGRTHPAVNA